MTNGDVPESRDLRLLRAVEIKDERKSFGNCLACQQLQKFFFAEDLDGQLLGLFKL